MLTTAAAGIRIVRHVERAARVDELPMLHAVAIRLRDEGLDDHVIAVALAVDDDQVTTLLAIAEAKLAGLEAGDTAPRDAPDF